MAAKRTLALSILRTVDVRKGFATADNKAATVTDDDWHVAAKLAQKWASQ